MKRFNRYFAMFLLLISFAGCGDEGGNSSGGSSTAPVDTALPTVISVSPANDRTNVAVNTAIIAVFSEPMTSSTINTSTFILSGSITGTVTYNASTNTATFTSASNLLQGTTYTAAITTSVKDANGNAMASDYTWSFTTGPPTVVGSSKSSSGSIALAKLREIPSLSVDSTNGLEIMENFAFDPALPIGGTNYPMIITGGKGSGPYAMVLVDANTGTVYRPDTTTNALFTVSSYIDAAAVDTTYHIAILADEGIGTTFVDLNQLTLNAVAGTYTLPAAAVSRITTYYKYTNVAIESTKHLAMMGEGYGGTSLVIGLLKDPSVGLGFSKEALGNMPSGVDDTGATITWSGSYDPHGNVAYITDASHPVYTTPTALALWVNGAGTHIAIIDMQGLLDGWLTGGGYNPMTTTPQDIAYFKMP